MSNKLLFGKELASYDDEDLDELLSKLTEEELQQLNDDFDPDNTLLPPSQRCRDQTTKEPTGPLNREKLLKFLIDKAKSEKDWEEAVPYEKKVRGQVFQPKKTNIQVSKQELTDMGFDVEFDEDVNEALEKATEDELVDLAAVLGFTGLLNQVQFHASMDNRKLEGGGFSGVAKGERPKPIPDEPPNTTDVEVGLVFGFHLGGWLPGSFLLLLLSGRGFGRFFCILFVHFIELQTNVRFE
ncbi:hypothetical protein EG68_12255 [Paragonimus skrjabini miyazakii]|uniref:Tropomodulin n=1 Tax=Paragonimus skrjabini miyazakii TaxID=59628 RepID=A0A8S9Y812_9TREM|nr:hypothetical protein EG68_12255 [Paragonimus skrjabini miyazakii]